MSLYPIKEKIAAIEPSYTESYAMIHCSLNFPQQQQRSVEGALPAPSSNIGQIRSKQKTLYRNQEDQKMLMRISHNLDPTFDKSYHNCIAVGRQLSSRISTALVPQVVQQLKMFTAGEKRDLSFALSVL